MCLWLKGIVQPQTKILSFTLPYVVPNPFFLLWKTKGDTLKKVCAAIFIVHMTSIQIYICCILKSHEAISYLWVLNKLTVVKFEGSSQNTKFPETLFLSPQGRVIPNCSAVSIRPYLLIPSIYRIFLSHFSQTISSQSCCRLCLRYLHCDKCVMDDRCHLSLFSSELRAHTHTGRCDDECEIPVVQHTGDHKQKWIAG